YPTLQELSIVIQLRHSRVAGPTRSDATSAGGLKLSPEPPLYSAWVSTRRSPQFREACHSRCDADLSVLITPGRLQPLSGAIVRIADHQRSACRLAFDAGDASPHPTLAPMLL